MVWGSIWSIFFLALGLAGYAHYMVGVYRAEVPMLKTEADIKMLQSLSSGFFIGVSRLIWCFFTPETRAILELVGENDHFSLRALRESS